MTVFLKTLTLSLVFFSVGNVPREEGILIVQVLGVNHRPIPGVRFTVAGDNSIGPPTDVAGRTRIKLAPQTRPKTWIKLILVSVPPGRDLVFLSPYNASALIPPFENEAQNFVEVVLAEHGQRLLLEDPAALRALTERTVNAKVKGGRVSAPDEPGSGQSAIDIVAKSFGLTREALDSAVKHWAATTTNSYDKGIAALYLGRPTDAARALSASISQPSSKGPASDQGFSAAFFLGGSLMQQGQYRDAATFLRKAVSIQPNNGEAAALLAAALSEQGDLEAAEPILRQATANFERSEGANSVAVAMVSNELAILLGRKGDYPGAERAIRRSLEILAARNDSTELVPALTTLGSVLRERGDFAGADITFKQALSLADRTPPPNRYLFLSQVLKESGLSHGIQGLYVEADSLFSRSLTIQQKIWPPGHPEIGHSLQQLGRVRAEQGKIREADSLLRRAVAILEGSLGPEHPAVGAALNNLGMVVSAVDLPQAEQLVRKALAIEEKAVGRDHPMVADALMSLAWLRMKNGDNTETAILLRRAITILDHTVGANHPQTMVARKALAELH